ncbi:MAG: Hint domain-containing protein [Pseudoruegeria sp.]
MSWLALMNARLSGIRQQNLALGYSGEKGSLVVELELCASRKSPYLAFEYQSESSDENTLVLRIDPYGTCQLEIGSAHQESTVAAKSGTSFSTRQLRITYSWCAEDNSGLFTVENLMDGWLSQTEICNPVTISADIISDMSANPEGCRLDKDIHFLGFSDALEPVGLPASIAAGARIATSNGFQTIETLRVGDLVQTRDSGLKPIRWMVERCVPAVGSFRPIELRAPFFGLEADLLVAPDQRLLIEGTSVEYLFGEEEMLVEARHLLDDRAARKSNRTGAVTYYHILLDDHEVICASGAELESLYIGDICDSPALVKSTILADCSLDHLPRHEKLARPLIRAYEAPTLRLALNS